MAAEVDSCSVTAAQWLAGPPVLFQRGWEHDGFQPLLARQDAPTLEEAAPDHCNNAHLVLHPIEDFDWSSGSDSQPLAKTQYEFHDSER